MKNIHRLSKPTYSANVITRNYESPDDITDIQYFDEPLTYIRSLPNIPDTEELTPLIDSEVTSSYEFNWDFERFEYTQNDFPFDDNDEYHFSEDVSI